MRSGNQVREVFQKNKNTFQVGAKGCFYLAVMIEVLIVLIDKSAWINPVEGMLFRLTFLLCFVKVCLTKYSLREYLVIGLFLGVSAVSYFVTGRDEPVRIVMFVAACKNIDMKKCLKLVFWLTLAGCIAIVTLSILGIGGALSLTQDYGRGGVETRYTLGMGHPNALHCMIWALTVLGLYLYHESLKWYSYGAIVLINLFFFFLTDSKTGLIMSLFTVIYMAAFRFVKKETWKRLCAVCGILATAGSVAISVFCAATAYHAYNYSWGKDRSAFPAFIMKLNKVLTGRIYELVGTTRWEGTTRTWSLFSEPANNYFFDMGWVRLFYWYGIIPAILAILVLFVVMFYCLKKKQYAALALLVAFAIYSIVEAHAVSVYIARNYVLFMIGAYWSEIVCRKNLCMEKPLHQKEG